MTPRAGGGNALLTAALLTSVLLLVASPASADLPDPQHDPDEVRQQAEEVLGRPEFDRPDPGPIERAQQWVSERLNQLLEDLIGGGRSSIVGWFVLAVAIGAVVFFSTRFGQTMQRDPGIPESVDVDPARSGADWRSEAERHEAEGRWKEALRCRYRALVTDLVRGGVVEDVAGRTTGEYRREVAQAAPPAGVPFAGATELFELAWYGNRPTGEEQNRRFRELAAETEERARVVKVS